MIEKKFCCERFSSMYENGEIFDEKGTLIKELYPNIKIIKLEENKLNKESNLYRFIIVCGFIKDKPPVIYIKHCPFCGIDLYNIYCSEKYINGKPL